MIYTLQPIKEGESRAMACPHCATPLMLIDATQGTSQTATIGCRTATLGDRHAAAQAGHASA